MARTADNPNDHTIEALVRKIHGIFHGEPEDGDYPESEALEGQIS
jgi:hypothetical protein